MWLALVVVALAMAVSMVMMAVQEAPIIAMDTDTDSNTMISMEYNLIDLDAPALAGPLLTIFAQLFSKSILRPFFFRFLLNKNNAHHVRELAAKLEGVPPTYFPMARLSSEEYDYHVTLSHGSSGGSTQEQIRTDGLPKIRNDGTSNYRSVMDYHELYKSEKATPLMTITKVIEGCHKLEHLHMFSSFLPDDVMEQARVSTERWKEGKPISIWDGVPIAVKDMVHVQGHLCCSGSKRCTPSEKDDTVVGTFRKLGAIILGVTVMTEGGMSPLGYSLWFDGPFNPYHVDYYSGGSSSGSGVLVAAGLVPVAIGYDGGGSIRIPASMSGTMGLATTFGRVESDSTDMTVIKSGPLAATVQDTALAHLVMGQVNTSHAYSKLYDGGVRGTPPAHVTSFQDSIEGMRIGIFSDHFHHSDPEVVEACMQTVKFLKSQGVEVVEIVIPHLREIHLSHGFKILSEFMLDWDSMFHDPNQVIEASTAINIALAKTLTANEVIAGERVRTWALDWVRNKIFRDLKLDVIVSPTLGGKVPKPKPGFRQTGESNTPLVYKMMRFIPLANFLGLPGMSIPVGYEKATGLPIGFQLLGDAWMEHKLLRIASAIEAQHLKRRKPPSENYHDPLAEWLN